MTKNMRLFTHKTKQFSIQQALNMNTHPLEIPLFSIHNDNLKDLVNNLSAQPRNYITLEEVCLKIERYLFEQNEVIPQEGLIILNDYWESILKVKAIDIMHFGYYVLQQLTSENEAAVTQSRLPLIHKVQIYKINKKAQYAIKENLCVILLGRKQLSSEHFNLKEIINIMFNFIELSNMIPVTNRNICIISNSPLKSIFGVNAFKKERTKFHLKPHLIPLNVEAINEIGNLEQTTRYINNDEEILVESASFPKTAF